LGLLFRNSGASGKGPGIFWEKEWGSINEDSYQQHTVPIIQGWIRLNEFNNIPLVLMQDNASGHASKSTRELQERGIEVIFWPAFSPDLNPIEMCWNWMKDYIQHKWGLAKKPSSDKLRRYVNEAWEALPEEYLRELLASMPARCQAVIEANGMYTKY
jgi:transposase